ncbi:MAG: hypothetical protein SFY69_05395 [Planctomycetota bacterium]|nr:hypothetical protein [Planctomycetota bacterium]
MASVKSFNSSAEAKAYFDKQSQKISAAVAKIDAAIIEADKLKAKVLAKVPDGYTAASVKEFERKREMAKGAFKSLDIYLAGAKARAKEAMVALKI